MYMLSYNDANEIWCEKFRENVIQVTEENVIHAYAFDVAVVLFYVKYAYSVLLWAGMAIYISLQMFISFYFFFTEVQQKC